MINDTDIQFLVKTERMIVPYDEKLLNPHSYNCKLGSNFRVPDPKQKGIFLNVDLPEDGVYRLPPLSFVLAHTQEIIRVPKNMVGFFAGRSSIARNGLIVESAGLLDCEFEGQITAELFNESPWELELPVGLQIGQVFFHESRPPQIKSYLKIGSYNGQLGARPPVFTL